MVLGHHMFLNIVLKICKIQMELLDYSVNFNVFSLAGPQRAWHLIQSHSDCYGMKSLCNFLKQWETRNMQWRLRSSGRAAFRAGLLALSVQMNGYIHIIQGD